MLNNEIFKYLYTEALKYKFCSLISLLFKTLFYDIILREARSCKIIR